MTKHLVEKNCVWFFINNKTTMMHLFQFKAYIWPNMKLIHTYHCVQMLGDGKMNTNMCTIDYQCVKARKETFFNVRLWVFWGNFTKA